MTFLHKLAQRLARMKTWWMITALALAACERPIAAVDPATSRVAIRLEVSPATVTLLPNQTTDLTAVGLTASGDTGVVTVVWTVTGGAIVDTSATGGKHYGRYQSGSTPGQYTVVAHGIPGGLSDTATVTVSAVPVAAVTVSPTSASLAPGATQQLSATPQDANGNPLSGRPVTWISNNSAVAQVSGTGLVTAVAAGSATVTATSEGKSGSATITVTAPPPPPPPPPPGGTILTHEAFEDGAFASRGWYDNTGMTTTTAQHIAGSTRALEARFTIGATTPTWGGAARHLFPATESVYLSYWVKYSANWVGSGQAYHPHEFLLLTTENDAYVGPSFTHLTAYVEHSYQNGGIPVLQLQDGQNIDQGRVAQDLTAITESRSAAGCNGNADGYATGCYDTGGGVYNNEKKWMASRPYLMPAPGPGYKNDWHLVEAYFQLNSIQNGRGVPDGVVRYWFDGQLVIERTDVLLRTGAHSSMKFNQLMIAPYIGSGSSVDQTMWVDDLTVATARP